MQSMRISREAGMNGRTSDTALERVLHVRMYASLDVCILSACIVRMKYSQWTSVVRHVQIGSRIRRWSFYGQADM